MKKFDLELTEDNIRKSIGEYNKKLELFTNLIYNIDCNINICIDGDWRKRKNTVYKSIYVFS